jgi:hypothetical protein
MSTKKLLPIKVIVIVAAASMLAGCASLRYGGAPEPSFNLKADINELNQHFGLSASITGYYKNPSKEARNQFIIGRLTLINLRYLEFVRNLTKDRQLLDSAVGMALLGLNLAGTAVPAAQTKTVLFAISAGLIGSKEVIDKNFYFEKTIGALVAQMNAERQKALNPLLQGMKLSLDDYPFEYAVVDLDAYYNAGTFTGAVQAIQADAATKEKDAIKQNQKVIPMATAAQTAQKANLTDSLNKLANTPENLGIIKTALNLISILKGDKLTPKEDFDGAKKQLQQYIRDASLEDLDKFSDVFMKAGILS